MTISFELAFDLSQYKCWLFGLFLLKHYLTKRNQINTTTTTTFVPSFVFRTSVYVYKEYERIETKYFAH